MKLPHAPQMAYPYANKEERMTDGIYAVSKMLGDPKFHTHEQVDAKVADRWRKDYTEDFIGDPTWTLAMSLGYDRPQTKQAFRSIKRVSRRRQTIRQTKAGQIVTVR